MSEFDLERAKAGEPMLCKNSYWKHSAHFVGLSVEGIPVVQRDDGIKGYSDPFVCSVEDLNMAPKKVTVRYRNYAYKSSSTGKLCMSVIHHELDVAETESSSDFVAWIHTEWQTAEIRPDLTDKETL